MSANVLVVHGGGPTAIINASLYGVVEEAKSSGSIGQGCTGQLAEVKES